jgi:sugar/nucleoside kinase (ribokinase family)
MGWLACKFAQTWLKNRLIHQKMTLGRAFMNKKILAFGNPVYDVISTPSLVRAERVLSGCSTNACLAAAYLGEHATLVGTVGEDFRSRLQADLDERNVSYHLLPSKETGGFSLIYYDDHGNRHLSILGTADDIPTFVDGVENADIVLIGPILGEVHAELVEEIKRRTQAPIVVDPQGLLRGSKDGKIYHEMSSNFEKIAAMATVLKANELETKVVTGIEPRDDPEKAVRALYQFGCKIAVTTLAEAGSIIYDGQKVYIIPPFTTNAIDPTGAGDTYAAGFMVKYLETPDDLRAVGCFGSAVASVMVENSGPDFPLNRQEADWRQAFLLSQPQKLAL